jgi:ParB/RepB/Spo0J family partition protein
MVSFTQPIERAPAHTVPLAPPILPPAPIGPATLEAMRFIPLELIHPSPFNPRKAFDEAGLAELAESIRVNGLQQNLVVRPHPKKKEHFELMGGERRLRALQLLKAEGALCKIDEASDGESLARQLVENLQREDVKPMEEAEAFKALIESNPKVWTTATVAATIGKTQRFVQQRIALATRLDPAARKLVEKGELSVEKARTLAMAPARLQKEILEDNWQFDEMSAEDLRHHILEEMVPAEAAAFDLAALHRRAGTTRTARRSTSPTSPCSQ